MNELIIKVEAEDAGLRTDVFLSERCDITRSAAQNLISSGSVTATVGEKPIKVTKSAPVSAGCVFTVIFPETEECDAAPENIPINIVYEDDDIIVVNKQRGMVVHPAPGHQNGTLVSALLYHCGSSLSGINGVLRPGIVHRIDRDTTGLIAAAKNDYAHLALAEQLADHSMHRIYYAIVTGNIKDDSGTVDAPIGRHPTDRKKMAVLRGNPNAKNAVTHYTVLERFPGFTYLKLKLETGRTHQIRVHMSHIGHPLAGDTIYGGGKTQFEKKHPAVFSAQMLHAGELEFIHPSSKMPLTLRCDPPDDFKEALRLLEILQQ